MRGPAIVGLLVLVSVAPAGFSEQRRARDSWWDGGCSEQLFGGPCEVKIESKPGEYKREVKCKDGTGADWERGEWKEEYRDGPCLVKIEAKRDEYKEQIVCD